MIQGIPLYQVDAFTSRPFEGNPAAVCILPQEIDAEWMQQVAMEMNLAETAFLVAQGSDFELRWFTPAVEVDLCGHATLAAAFVLWEAGYLYPGEEARFHTRSGLLTARRSGDLIEMDFPATPVSEISPPPGLLEALGIEGDVRFVGESRFDYLIEVADEATVRGVKPDFGVLKKFPRRAVIVTSRATNDAGGNGTDATEQSREYAIVSRLFGPAVGIDEDPVTGSAHCALGPYWTEKLGLAEFWAYQASARGGSVRVTVDGDRIVLAGHAVMVLRGELVLAD